MPAKIEIILSDDVIECLNNAVEPRHKFAAVRDVLLTGMNELVPQVASEGLRTGVTITKQIGITYDGECAELETK